MSLIHLSFILAGYIYVAICTYIAVLAILSESASRDQQRAAGMAVWPAIFWPFFIGSGFVSKIIGK